MSDKNPVSNESNAAAVEGASKSSKPRIRGSALDGAEQRDAVDHTDYERSRNPDTELRLDGEDDSLYSDGLDIGDDSEPLAGTDGNSPKGIKGGVP
jgi:hypothetical protein